MWISIRVFLGVCIFLLLSHCSPTQQSEILLSGPTMGTIYNIKYVQAGNVDAQDLQNRIDEVLLNVNKLMSTYMPDSELSLFNQWQSSEPFALSQETLFVMQEAKRLGELSGGLLDVTVGPLVNLWGFGPQARPEKAPDEAVVAGIRARTGLEKLILHADSASKTEPLLYVDLSTIAKGYGVDRVADLLEKLHITNYLVEIGGEMRLSGKKGDGTDWRIAIEKPLSQERAVEKIISVGDNGIATSGDYRNYFEQDGIRYSHLIDPITGRPITHNLVSVTVVASSCMTADGLATALNIMGKDKALALATEKQLAVLLITKEGDQFKEYTSPLFDQIVTVY